MSKKIKSNIKYSEIVNKIIIKTQEFLEVPSIIEHEKLFIKYLEKQLQNLDISTQNNKNKCLIAKTKKDSNFIFSTHIDRHGFYKVKNNLFYAAFEFLKKNNLKLPHEVRKVGEDSIITKIKNKVDNDLLSVKEYRDFVLLSDEEHKNIKFSKPFSLDFFEKVGLRYVRDNIRGYNQETGEIGEWIKIQMYLPSVNSRTVSFNILDEDKTKIENFSTFQLNSKCKTFDNLFSGQIDNIISTATIITLIEEELISGTFIFTTLEEVGQSYKQVVEYYNNNSKELNNKQLIILDTSPYDSFEDKKEGFLTLRYGDENGGFDSKLVEKIKSLVESNDISYDFKPSFMGKTELGRISTETKGKINGTTIQLPTLNYHTSHETCELKGIENYAKILVKLLED